MWDTAPTVCVGPRNQYWKGGRQTPEVQAEREYCVLQASRPGPEENRCTHTLSEVSAPVAEGLGRRVGISAGLVVPWDCAAAQKEQP